MRRSGRVRVVVIGAGLAGLGAALALGRAGHRVILVERDGAPPDIPLADCFDGWKRPGAAQSRQPHNFKGLFHKLLRDHAPDVLDALFRAGAHRHDIGARTPGGSPDPDLVAIRSRRLLVERAIHQGLASSDVEIRYGTGVEGLLADGAPVGGVPTITGVRTAGGGSITSDLVVDGSGRASRLHAWLAEVGVRRVEPDVSDCGSVYYTRWFRMRDAFTPPQGNWDYGPTGDPGYLRFALNQADGRVFSLTFSVPPWDADLKLLRHEAAWMAAARTVELRGPWVSSEASDPISPVESFGKLMNTLHHYVVDGRPIVLGLHALGDNLCQTNPNLGWGAALALLHGYTLRNVLAEHPGDPVAQAIEMDRRLGPDCAERYAISTQEDQSRARLWRGETQGPPGPDDYPLFMRRFVSPAAWVDPAIFRAHFRRAHLLDPPRRLMTDLPLLERARDIVTTQPRAKPAPQPARDQFVGAMHAALRAAAIPIVAS